MIEIKNRKPNQKEIEIIESWNRLSKPQKLEGQFWIWIFMGIPTIIFFVIFADSLQTPIWSFLLFIWFPCSVFLTLKIDKFINKKERFNDLEKLDFLEIHCQSKRAAMIEDPEDFGIGYYFEVEKEKTLFLQGQYLYEERFELLPNSNFKIVLDKESGICIDVILLGESLKLEIELEAFSMKEWREGKTPENGDLIEESFDEIIAERLKIQNKSKKSK